MSYQIRDVIEFKSNLYGERRQVLSSIVHQARQTKISDSAGLMGMKPWTFVDLSKAQEVLFKSRMTLRQKLVYLYTCVRTLTVIWASKQLMSKNSTWILFKYDHVHIRSCFKPPRFIISWCYSCVNKIEKTIEIINLPERFYYCYCYLV